MRKQINEIVKAVEHLYKTALENGNLSIETEMQHLLITDGNMKRLPSKTFHDIDAVSGNCFILHVIAS